MTDQDPVAILNTALQDRYRVERSIGAGGMAVVYLASDLRHGRKVALKVLRPELAAVVGADRFLAEIRTTATLQHPHILPLFDSGEAAPFLYYVMPWVEGESLRDRLDREHQLPVDEAVRIGIDLAEALHYAHERGVVHRDVKPANILLQSGRPLIADFGIALAVGVAAGRRLTETGIALGTPHYMSPEQATGDTQVGPATDIYALGCVVYEMLVGEPPYTGSTPQAILGRILGGDPDPVTVHRRSVPRNVEAALARALEKLPADRFTDAQALARALDDPSYVGARIARGAPRASAGTWKLVGIGASLGAGVLLALVIWLTARTPAAVPVGRFPTPFLTGQEPGPGLLPFGLSRDGAQLIYRDQQGRLWLRRWDRLEATPLPARGRAPTFSPDGQSIAFEDGALKVLALGGGSERTIAQGANIPMWGSDDRIYFTREGSAFSVLPDGSDERRVSSRETGFEHYVSDALPGGRSLIIVVRQPATESYEIHRLDLETGAHEPLVAGFSARYLEPGFLVYAIPTGRGLRIVASRLDPRTFELGTAVTIADAVSNYAAAGDKLLYATALSRQAPRNLNELAWVDRDGGVEVIDAVTPFEVGPLGARRYALSTDDSRLAARALTEDGYDIWIFDLVGGARTRLTSHPAMDRDPAWHPDGARVSFLSDRGGNADVWIRPANGTGEPELLLDLEEAIQSADWAPDGTLLVETGGDVLTFRPGVDEEPAPLLAGPFAEVYPTISPDSRWIAYASNESGRSEIYLRPYPNVGADRRLVSRDGGSTPDWSGDGRQLFWRGSDQSVMMLGGTGSAGPPFAGEAPVHLFDAGPPWSVTHFAVSRTGTPFLMARLARPGAGEQDAPEFVLITGLRSLLDTLPPL